MQCANISFHWPSPIHNLPQPNYKKQNNEICFKWVEMKKTKKTMENTQLNCERTLKQVMHTNICRFTILL